MTYVVYDIATKQIIKSGVAADADACEMQAQGFGQAVLVADTAEEMETLKAEAGVE